MQKGGIVVYSTMGGTLRRRAVRFICSLLAAAMLIQLAVPGGAAERASASGGFWEIMFEPRAGGSVVVKYGLFSIKAGGVEHTGDKRYEFEVYALPDLSRPIVEQATSDADNPEKEWLWTGLVPEQQYQMKARVYDVESGVLLVERDDLSFRYADTWTHYGQLQITYPAAGEAVLSWLSTTSPYVQYYNVQLHYIPDNRQSVTIWNIQPGQSMEAHATELVPGYTYLVIIQSIYVQDGITYITDSLYGELTVADGGVDPEPIPPQWPVGAVLGFSDTTDNSFRVDWPAADEKTALYEVALNGTAAASLGADARTYAFSGLTADMAYEVTVRAGDGTGVWSEPLTSLHRTLPALAVGELRWSAPLIGKAQDNRALKRGERMQLSLQAAPEGEAAVRIRYDSWLDEQGQPLLQPIERTAEVAMTEAAEAPSRYDAEWEMAESLAIAYVHEATASWSRPGQPASQTAAAAIGLPLTGSVRATLSGGGQLPAMQALLRQREGAESYVQAIGESGSYLFPHVVPAADYELRLTDAANGTLLYAAPLDPVASGRTTETQAAGLGIAELTIALRDEFGSAVEGAALAVDIGGAKRYGRTAADGRVVFRNGITEGQLARIASVSGISGELRDAATGAEWVLQPGENEHVIVLPLKREKVMLTGSVTSPDGALSGYKLVFTQKDPLRYNGADRIVHAETNEHGQYEAELLEGLAYVEGERAGAVLSMGPTQITVDASQPVRDFAVLDNAKGSIRVSVREREFRTEEWQTTGPDEMTLAKLHGYAPVLTNRDTGRIYPIKDYPIEVEDRGGTRFRLCIRYTLYNGPYQCQELQLNAEREAVFDYDLSAGGARVELGFASGIRPLYGMPESQWMYRIVSHEGGYESEHLVPYLSTRKAAHWLPQGGTYTVYAHQPARSTGQNLRRTFTIGEGETLQLGELGLSDEIGNEPYGSLSIDYDTLLPGEEVKVGVSYRKKSGGDYSPAQLRVKLPAGATVAADGVLLGNMPLPEADWRLEGNVLTADIGAVLPNDRDGADLEAYVKIPATSEGSEAVFTGYLDYTADGRRDSVLLGKRRVPVRGISLEVPEHAHSRQLEAGGRAVPGSLVSVYEDGTLLGRMTAPASGYWRLPVELPSRGNTERYVLHAVSERDGLLYSSEEKEVLYGYGAPVIEEVTLHHYGNSQTFRPQDGVALFPFLLEPSLLWADIKFDQPDAVSHVKLHIGAYELTALRTASGVHRAVLNLREIHTIEGALDISYSALPEEKSELMQTEEELRSSLPWTVKHTPFNPQGQPELTYEETTERRTFDLSLPGMGEGATLHGDFVFEPDVAGVNLNNKRKFTAFGKTIYDYAVDFERGESFPTPFTEVPTGYRDSAAMLKKFLREGKGKGVSFTVRFSGYIPVDRNEWRPAAIAMRKGNVTAANAAMQITKTSAEIVLDGIDMGLNLEGSGSLEATLDSINNDIRAAYQACSSDSATYYHARMERIMEDAMLAESTKWAANMLGFLSGSLLPGPGLLAGAIIFLSTQIYGKLVDKIIQDKRNELKLEMIRDLKCEYDPETGEFGGNDARKRQRVANPSWQYDPSGYVYEAIPSHRLSGVKATIMQWNEELQGWEDWDAEWFNQINPQSTNDEGRYRWDVPQGLWKVRYEKEGYVTAYSDELKVLPPHFDVNIPMVSTEAPTLQEAGSEDGGASILFRFSRYMKTDSLVGDGTVSVTKGDTMIRGTVQPLREELGYAGVTLAHTFLFTPEVAEEIAAGDELELIVSAAAESYNSLPLADSGRLLFTVEASDTTPPGAPEDVSVIAVGDAVHVMWRDPSAADLARIAVEWKEQGTASYRSMTIEKGKEGALIEELNSGAWYEVRLRALDEAGNASLAVSRIADTPAAPAVFDTEGPEAIAGLAVTRASDSFKLEWQNPGGTDFHRVRLLWRAAGEEQQQVQYISAPASAYTLTELKPDTSYELVLIAEDDIGNDSVPVLQSVRTLKGAGNGAVIVPPAYEDGTIKRLPWSLWKTKDEVEAWPGTLWLTMNERWQAAGPDYSGGIRVRQLSGERLDWPKDERYRHSGVAYELMPMSGYDTAWPHPLLLSLAVPDEEWDNVNRSKLGIYRLDDAGVWQYEGGRWSGDGEMLSVLIRKPGLYALLSYSPSFPDLTGHWSREKAEELAALHLTEGTGSGLFRPDRQVTRAEMAAFAVRLLEWLSGEPLAASPDKLRKYRDVDADAWYAAVLATAVEQGLLLGDGAKLRPHDPLTREEAAVIVWRVVQAGRSDGDMSEAAQDDAAGYADQSELSSWAREAVGSLSSRGVLAGYPDGRFRPGEPLTRAQAAGLLWHVLQYMN
ncbi:S-layer homology domain-containing protein [Paenibacillus sp. J5C_2022]|nr:S-layer homology domain-containing protein [Paenibacillus sp. J5C2022]